MQPAGRKIAKEVSNAYDLLILGAQQKHYVKAKYVFQPSEKYSTT
jgi:hypothetical protein